MDRDEEAPASSPFAPSSALARTPPSSFQRAVMRWRGDPVLGDTTDSDEDLPLAERLAREKRSGAAKRALTSPEERRPTEKVRMCRPSPESQRRETRTATPAAAAAAAAADGAGSGSRAPPAPPTARPRASTPSSTAVPPTVSAAAADGDVEQDGSLSSATKAQLMDRVHNSVEEVMAAVTGPTSRVNKEATNAISGNCREILAVVAALALKMGDLEVELSQAQLRAAEAERELLRAKLQPSAIPVPSSVAAPMSFATALKTSKKAEPVPIPAAQGPVLAFYPAPDHAETFKSAEDTKSELKKHIKPQEMNVQVDRVRKVGNAGVVVQTTSEASAEKLKRATPATLRVTEPKRRPPLVSLRHIDGDGDIEFVMNALYEQNFEGSEWTPERLRTQSRLAFKKRGRGTTTVVLECSPKLREALIAKDRLYIGWQVIEVVDFLTVTCCRKCHQYGHPEKYCRATEVFCGRCGAAGHKREDCTSATECCATCKRFNKADAMTHNTAAAVCPARQYAESRSISNTNYGQ